MKTQELVKLQRLNLDMLDANRNLTSCLVDIYEKHGITHEEFNRAKMLLIQASRTLAKLNGKPYQPMGNTNKTDEEVTEPQNNNVIKY
jgi:hypothetical protein